MPSPRIIALSCVVALAACCLLIDNKDREINQAASRDTAQSLVKSLTQTPTLKQAKLRRPHEPTGKTTGQRQRVGIQPATPASAAGGFRTPELRRSFHKKRLIEHRAAQQTAQQALASLPLISEGITAQGRAYQLTHFSAGHPYYRGTCNENASISANVQALNDPNGIYQLRGQGIRVGVWDHQACRTSHREFDSRSTASDNASQISYHHTHVSGTVIGNGSRSSALGMAPEAELLNHDWNDDFAEMSLKAAATPLAVDSIILSNHSYLPVSGWEEGNYSGNTGWHWLGSSNLGEPLFGQYGQAVRTLDQLCVAAPYYLPFWAAGNDRNDGPEDNDITYRFTSGAWVESNYDAATHPPREKDLLYDLLAGEASAKNNMVVGAVNDAVLSGSRSTVNATMASFSSWGPTDDGRIKPDIVANGVSVTSAGHSSDNSYTVLSGTSMASPSAMGGALLIQQRHSELFSGEFMRASALKALIIHTADDLGNNGPDYSFGWGLINAQAAVDTLDLHAAHPSRETLSDQSLSLNQTSFQRDFQWDGTSSQMRLTICWTDPVPNYYATTLNNSMLALVNDLDIRVTTPSGDTLEPWILDPSNPSLAATKGDNFRDNIEQIVIHAPETGNYTIRVTHKGQLQQASQIFSLVITGQSGQSTHVSPNLVISTSSQLYAEVPAISQRYTLRHQLANNQVWTATSDRGWISLSSQSGSLDPDVEFDIQATLQPLLAPQTVGVHTANITIQIGNQTINRSIVLYITPPPPPTEQFTSSGDSFDLANKQLTFTPSINGYTVEICEAWSFPNGTTSAEILDANNLSGGNPDDGFWLRTPDWSVPPTLFGLELSTLHIDTNGYIRFSPSTSEYQESSTSHFANHQIALMWNDLNPSEGGNIYYQFLPSKRTVITYQNVSEFGSSNSNSAQLEIFDDGSGRIRFTFLEIDQVTAITGLSNGAGTSAGVWPAAETNFTDAPTLPPPTIDEPHAMWKMDEASGFICDDSSSQQHVAYHSPTGITISKAMRGNARQFSGSESFITLPPLYATRASTTLCGWVKTSSQQAAGTGLIFHRSGSSAAGIHLEANNTLAYHWNDSAYEFDDAPIIPLDTWCFVALTVSPSKATIYLYNGQLIVSKSRVASHQPESFSSQSYIGHDAGNSAYFAGEIDDVRFYQTAFSEEDMLQIFRQGLSEYGRYAWDLGLSGDDLLSNIDTDGDGFSNLLEFALGSSVNSRDTPFTHKFSNGKLVLEYSNTFNTSSSGLTITPQWSTDLVNWQTEGINQNSDSIEVPLTDNSTFIRILIIEN